jgi:hypothetical protein
LNAVQLIDLNIGGHHRDTYIPLRFVVREKVTSVE